MRILLLYTGGTIGMIKDSETNALIPGDINLIQKCIEKHVSSANIEMISTNEIIDSSEFTLDRFEELAILVKNNYTAYDAFIVAMGTDTMAYISSLLSYAITGLQKPIVFTGGQFPLETLNSDSEENLIGAVKGVLQNKFPNEVGIYFCEKWYRSVCVTKIDSEAEQAYLIPNKHTKYIPDTTNFTIRTSFNANIVVLKLHPFMNEAVLTVLLQSNTTDGIILEAFGSGNLPRFSEGLKKLFTEKIEQGLKIVVVSQCLKGGVSVGRYAASSLINTLGFINGGKLTTESALSKMLFLHEKKLNYQQYVRFFEESIKGE